MTKLSLLLTASAFLALLTACSATSPTQIPSGDFSIKVSPTLLIEMSDFGKK